jgi:hypothetical protein
MEIYPPGQDEPIPDAESRGQRFRRIAIDVGIGIFGFVALAAELTPFIITIMQ